MRTFLVLMAVLTLSGCSRLDLAVRWADTAVMSSVTDHFELSSDQKKKVRAEFNTAFQRVKKEDFPLVADRLESMAARLERGPIDVATYDAMASDNAVLWKKIALRFESMAHTLVESQSATAFKYYDREFQRNYEKGLKEAQDPKKSFKKSKKNIDRLVSETIEYLTDEQQAELDALLRATPHAQHVESKRHVFELFQTVRGDEIQLKTFIHTYLADWKSLHTAEFQEARTAASDRFKKWIVKLTENLTEKQRRNAVENLRSRAAELRRIADKA